MQEPFISKSNAFNYKISKLHEFLLVICMCQVIGNEALASRLPRREKKSKTKSGSDL